MIENFDEDGLIAKVREKVLPDVPWGGNYAYHHMVIWTGGEVPVGVKIGDSEVRQVVYGAILGIDGAGLGEYVRVVNCGGNNEDLQVLLVGCNAQDVTPPQAGKVVFLEGPQKSRLNLSGEALTADI